MTQKYENCSMCNATFETFPEGEAGGICGWCRYVERSNNTINAAEQSINQITGFVVDSNNPHGEAKAFDRAKAILDKNKHITALKDAVEVAAKTENRAALEQYWGELQELDPGKCVMCHEQNRHLCRVPGVTYANKTCEHCEYLHSLSIAEGTAEQLARSAESASEFSAGDTSKGTSALICGHCDGSRQIEGTQSFDPYGRCPGCVGAANLLEKLAQGEPLTDEGLIKIVNDGCDAIRSRVNVETPAPDQPEMDFDTIERIAKKLCERSRGEGAWDKKGCKRNQWRKKATDRIKQNREWSKRMFNEFATNSFKPSTLKQRFARWVISKFTKAAT